MGTICRGRRLGSERKGTQFGSMPALWVMQASKASARSPAAGAGTTRLAEQAGDPLLAHSVYYTRWNALRQPLPPSGWLGAASCGAVHAGASGMPLPSDRSHAGLPPRLNTLLWSGVDESSGHSQTILATAQRLAKGR